MSDHVYKVTELVGSSAKSIEDAVQNAVERAARTLRNLRWLEVVDTRAHLEDGRIAHWQVTVKLGFTLDSEGDEGGVASASPRPRRDRSARRRRSRA